MENKEKNFLSAVIYVHNADRNVEEFLSTMITCMERNFEHSEIICVNDSSDDGSLEKIKKVAANASNTSISVVNMSYFHGCEASMNAGIDMAIGDFVFEFDNMLLDFDENIVMGIYRHSLEGFDVVSASPDRKEKFTSRVFYNVFDKFTDSPYKMSTESFRILSRRAINRIRNINKTVPYRKAVYANCGLKTDNVRYEVKYEKRNSVDKREQHYRSGLAVDSLLLFTEIGYRFSVIMTVIMMLMSVFTVIYSIAIYMTSHPIAGWTTTILFLSVAFFGLFGILTIIIKYLQLLVDLMFKRKHYSFESVEKLTK